MNEEQQEQEKPYLTELLELAVNTLVENLIAGLVSWILHLIFKDKS